MFYLMSNKQLLLWFYPKNDDIKSIIVIPESYILFKELQKRDEDAIYVIEDDLIKIIIIKNGIIVSTFVLKNYDENILSLSLNEHGLSKKIDITKDEYLKLLTTSKNNINSSDLYKFLQIDTDIKALFKSLVDIATYPIVVLIFFAMMVSYVQGVMLSSDIENLKENYIVQKQKNSEIKQKIKKHNQKVKKYEKFIDEELTFIGPIALLNSIYTVFEDGDKASIHSVTVNNTRVVLQIDTDENPIKYLNRLNQIKYFKDVVIKNTRKRKKRVATITYDIEVKSLKEL